MTRRMRSNLIQLTFLIVGCAILWVWVFGGSLPFPTLSIATSGFQPAVATVPTSVPATAVPPTQIIPTAAPQPTTLVSPPAAAAAATLDRTPVPVDTSPGIATFVLAVVLLGVIVAALTFGAFFIYILYKRWQEQRHQPETGAATAMASSGTPRRSHRTALPPRRTPALAGSNTTIIEATATVVDQSALPSGALQVQPWSTLPMADVLQIMEALRWDTPAFTLIDATRREHRIRELQARLGAPVVRVAPDYSLAVFEHIQHGHAELQRIAHPQPAILDLHRHDTIPGQPNAVAIVLLAQPTVVQSDEATQTITSRVHASNITSTPIPNIPPIQTVPIKERGMTAAAASSQAGKTSTMNTLLVEDLARGVQAAMLSTHFTYFHETDQPIDLRPLAPYFETAWNLADILDVLKAACHVIDSRMELYRANQDVGHELVLYIGEWREIFQQYGNTAVEYVQKIANQGTKTRVYIGFIEFHSALVAQTGGDSSFREAFRTRLVAGKVDPKTWTTFVGEQWKIKTIERGYWMTEAGLTQVYRPSIERIHQVQQHLERATQLGTRHGRPRLTPPAQQTPTDAAPEVNPSGIDPHMLAQLGRVFQQHAVNPHQLDPTLLAELLKQSQHSLPIAPDVLQEDSTSVVVKTPYELITAEPPERLTLAACVTHPVVIDAVIRTYQALHTQFGDQLSGRLLTGHVFESKPGLGDGNTSSRWNQVVLPILRNHNLALPTMEPTASSNELLPRGVSEQAQPMQYEPSSAA